MANVMESEETEGILETVSLKKQPAARLDYLDIAKGLARLSFAGGLVSGIISLAISCVLMAAIERYIPQLFGKKLGKAYS